MSEKAKAICRFCGSEHSDSKFKAIDTFDTLYEIRQCAECRCWFLYPPPTEEQLSQAYNKAYYGAAEEKFTFFYVEKLLDLFRRRRAKKIVKLVPEHSSILDIGCGNGDFLNYISKMGNYQLYGIERDEIASKRAALKTNIHLQSTALSETDFGENFFDIITLIHVFEHLWSPEQTLSIISNILKPGGILIITIPNIGSWQAKLFKGNWLHLDPPRHLLFFEPNDLIRIMQEKGFSLVKEQYFSIEQNPFGVIQSLLNLVCKKREVLYERMKGNMHYAPEYGRFNVFVQKAFFMLHFPLFIATDIIAALFKRSGTVKFTFKNTKS